MCVMALPPIVVNACDELLVHFSFLFNAMTAHCYAPEPFLSAIIVPIPKGARKSRNDSTNYRSVAIGNVIGKIKIFDKIVRVKPASILDTIDLQFSFKSKHCAFVFNAIVQNYISQGSPCCAVLFDRVHSVNGSRFYWSAQRVQLLVL